MKPRAQAKVFVASPAGFLGRALLGQLAERGYRQVVAGPPGGLDLRDAAAIEQFFEAELPDYVLLSFTYGGPGQVAFTQPPQPVQWLHDSLLSAANIIHAAYLYDVEKLVCIDCSATLLDLAPLPTSAQSQAEVLAEARRVSSVVSSATTELCNSYRLQYSCDFLSAVAACVYGPGVNFEVSGEPLLPTLVREVSRVSAAKVPRLRLAGHAHRCWDLLHLDDLTSASLFLLEHVSRPGLLPIGTGQPVTSGELAALVGRAAGYTGEVEFSGGDWPPLSPPLLDPQPLARLGWQAAVPLDRGVHDTYQWYVHHHLSVP